MSSRSAWGPRSARACCTACSAGARLYPSWDIDRPGRGGHSRRMPDGTRIEDWPLAERPCERLYHQGAAALADAELLGIQLGAGTRGRNAVELARDLLVSYGSLSALATRGVAELAG